MRTRSLTFVARAVVLSVPGVVACGARSGLLEATSDVGAEVDGGSGASNDANDTSDASAEQGGTPDAPTVRFDLDGYVVVRAYGPRFSS